MKECLDRTFDAIFVEDDSINITMSDENTTETTIFETAQWVDPRKHNELQNRDEAKAHPISAITGLRQELEELKAHVADMDVHITPEERESWNRKSRVYRDATGALVISV